MNRQNFFGHLALALTIVLVAAFAGQLRRWERHRKGSYIPPNYSNGSSRDVSTSDPSAPHVPEGLVRFRDGTSVDAIAQITRRHHDAVEDEMSGQMMTSGWRIRLSAEKHGKYEYRAGDDELRLYNFKGSNYRI